MPCHVLDFSSTALWRFHKKYFHSFVSSFERECCYVLIDYSMVSNHMLQWSFILSSLEWNFLNVTRHFGEEQTKSNMCWQNSVKGNDYYYWASWFSVNINWLDVWIWNKKDLSIQLIKILYYYTTQWLAFITWLVSVINLKKVPLTYPWKNQRMF